jgi:hypothetical protein
MNQSYMSTGTADESSEDERDDFELPKNAEEWHALYDEDVEEMYSDVKDLFDSQGHPLMCRASLPSFSAFCYHVFSMDRTVPFRARSSTVPMYLECPDRGGHPNHADFICRKKAYEPWCHVHRDAIRASYLLVVPELLDREFTDTYMEDWAKYLYVNK